MATDDLTDVLTASILHLPVACIISRASTTEIVAVNDAAVELFGYESQAELITHDVTSITSPGSRSELRDKHYQRKDGTDFEAQLFARPVAGHADIAIAVILDLAVTDSLRAGAVHSS